MRLQEQIIPGKRGGGFAFAADATGKKFFIHVKEFRQQTDETVLAPGTVLEFEAARDHANRPYGRGIVIVKFVSKEDAMFEQLCSGDLRDADLDGGHRKPRYKDKDKKKVQRKPEVQEIEDV